MTKGVMGPRLAVIVNKCPRLKNVYKSNGRCPTTRATIGRASVYTLYKIGWAHRRPLVGYSLNEQSY